MQSVLDFLHDAFHNQEVRANEILHAAIYVLIIASIGLFALELYLGPEDPSAEWIARIDRVVLWVFTLEVSLRVLTFRPKELRFYRFSTAEAVRLHITARLRFCLRPLILVDILTVLALVPILRSLRALRLLRLFESHRVLRYSNPFDNIARSFRDNQLIYAFAFTWFGIEVVVGGLTFYLAERAHNPDVNVLGDGVWWAMVTLTTVGFGDITPVTGIGKIVGAVMMVGGLFTLALFAGMIGHSLLHAVLTLREDQFRMSNYLDHVVICGFEVGSRMLLDALSQQFDKQETELVFFGPGDRPPDLPSAYIWVTGDPHKERELDKVRLAHARTVVIIGSRALPPQQADAATILITFTMRNYMQATAQSNKRTRPIYMVAEILESENVTFARTAGADEVIESTRLAFSLVAHAVVEHGTAEILTSFAAHGGLDVFVGRIPADITLPLPYGALKATLRQRTGMLVLGLRETISNTDRLNPSDDHVVTSNHQVVYLSEAVCLPTA